MRKVSKMSEIRPEMQLVVPGEYCRKCREFKPEVQESDIWANDRIVATARNIVCKNEALCRRLIDYLKQNGTDEESSPDDSEEDYVYCRDCAHYIESRAECKFDSDNKLSNHRPADKRFCKLIVEKE